MKRPPKPKPPELWQLDLVIGDRVIVRLDDRSEVEKTVRSAPWQLGHGQWVIGLSDISGGYSLERVLRKVEEQGAA